MNKITAVIIEDEIPAARRLNNTLNELRPEWQITVLPGSVKKSVEWFAENPHPDLVFLDIQLTDGISSSIMTAVILFIQYWDFNGKIIRIIFYGNILIAYQEVTG